MAEQTNQKLQLRLLQRLLSDKQPLSQCARALQAVLRFDPQVRSVWYFNWQASADIYSPEGDVRGWPPGPGDLLTATDQQLFSALQHNARLTITQVHAIDCWLSHRIKRAGISHGVVVSLPLQTDQEGLLVIELQQGVELYALDSLLLVLSAYLGSVTNERPSAELLSTDPQPALWVNHHAEFVEVNNAAVDRFGTQIAENTQLALPHNHQQLVRSSLNQQRVIEDVAAQFAEQVLLWSYIPCIQQQRVLVRGRVVTEQAKQLQEAAQASRLYRLITENTLT